MAGGHAFSKACVVSPSIPFKALLALKAGAAMKSFQLVLWSRFGADAMPSR
jgi:hypothetical protein